jgi:hypothetical protein
MAHSKRKDEEKVLDLQIELVKLQACRMDRESHRLWYAKRQKTKRIFGARA